VDIPTGAAPSELGTLNLDVKSNRAARKYSRREQFMRIAWAFGRWLIRLSPRPFFGWRRLVLRLFGAHVGREAHIYPSTHIYMPWNVEIGEYAAVGENVFIYSLGRVRIGDRAALSYRSHVCAGDAWVGTEAFIGPGVTVGCGALIAARAVVVKDVEPLTMVGGNPARVIGQRPSLKAARP
jgi:putative colanic acid biosynthesis acetyltransferase WcaF